MRQYSTFNINGQDTYSLPVNDQVEMPEWAHCFVSILKSDFDAARLLLLTLSYDQFYKLAVMMADQAGCDVSRTLNLLVGIKEGD